MTAKKNKYLIDKVFFIPVILVVSTLIIVLLLWSAPENKPATQPPIAVNVTPYRVKAITIKPHVQVTGRLHPANRALLRFEVSGQLEQRNVEPGVRVKAGDVLLCLSDADARDALSEAQARLEMETAAVKRDRRLLEIAASDVLLQQQEVTRLQQLRTESLVSSSRRDQARQKLLQLESNQAQLQYSVDTATARLTSARAALARAKRNLQRTRLTAPFDGTVNLVNFEVGDYVTPSAIAVELVDLVHTDLLVEVSSDMAAALALQQAVNVTISGQNYRGHIIALRSDPDPKTFTHAVRIRMDEGTLLPGALGRVALPLAVQEAVLAVPVSSLLEEDGHSYVFLIKDKRLQKREVQRGLRDRDRVIVVAGLQQGDQIVARDIAALTDGQKVVLQP